MFRSTSKGEHAMKMPFVLLATCAVLALPASAEITAKKDAVKGSRNLDVIRLDGATLFGSAEDILTPGGKKAIDKLIADNPNLVLSRIRVTGHTDNMGKPDDNRKLSLRRAEAVRKYLIAKDTNFRIEAAGLGETQPLVKCDEKKPRPELIRCLAPNRRVEIEKLYD
jgi:outer membrane protein OmpA-like peptidoglycan-associated protein